MIDDKELQEVATRIANSVPELWKQLYDQMADYAATRMTETVHADMQGVVILQGMTRQCVQFLEIFKKAADAARINLR